MLGAGPALCKDQVCLATCGSHVPTGRTRQTSVHTQDNAIREGWVAGGPWALALPLPGLSLMTSKVEAPGPSQVAPHTPVRISHMQISRVLFQREKGLR